MISHQIDGMSGRSQILIGESLKNISRYLPEAKTIVITDSNVLKHHRSSIPPAQVIELGSGGPFASPRIAPVARVSRDEFKYGKFHREELKDDVKTTVAPGQPASEVDFGMSYVSATVEYHKLKSRIADVIRANDPFNSLNARRTRMLTNKLLLGVERRVHGVVRQVEEERPGPMGRDEVDRFVGKPVGEILARAAAVEPRSGAVGMEIRPRCAGVAADSSPAGAFPRRGAP